MTDSSLESSLQAMSLWSQDSKSSGGAIDVEYCVIDWSDEAGLTVCLALFYLAMIAMAPDTEFDIKDEYARFNIWKWDDTGRRFVNKTSSRDKKQLENGDVELVSWDTHKDAQGAEYFVLYKGSTYLMEKWNEEHHDHYVFDHQTQDWLKGKLSRKGI